MTRLLERLSKCPDVHLILDFDGTLLPIRDDRADLRLPPQTRDALAAVADRPVTILSGRRTEELKAAFSGFQFAVAGLNGLQESPSAYPESLAVRECVTRILSRPEFLGVLLEDKGALMALHYRHLGNPDIGPILSARVRKALEELGYGQSWHAYHGKMVVNVEPRAASKAAFVLAYLARHPESTVLFAGDDRNDFPVFELDHPRLINVYVDTGPGPRPAGQPEVLFLSRKELFSVFGALRNGVARTE